jgi:hypothetical protein
MAMRGAHWIAVDAARLDLGAPASLDRIVDADHHLARGQEGVEHLGKELVRDGASVPARPAQHLVVACETRFRRQPHDSQRLAYRALAWRQHRSGNKHEDVVPNRRCEAVTEGGQPDIQNLGRQVRILCCRPGTGAMGRHRIRRIESRPSRKSPRCFLGRGADDVAHERYNGRDD